ncbi:hypothetical protein [Bacillus sp. M6-12]|uniref:hypothetical protein n=1 Tax=Bacillus sp. M6-12 TaxID=2054166 RepID=UPI00115807E7|nr:hypothetical protein [Bacillus sp. M6-12]
MLQKVLSFAKRRWKYILIAIIALIIGANSGPSQAEVDAAVDKNIELNGELDKKQEDIAEYKKSIKELKAEVKKAEPFLKLSAAELENAQKEAEAKAAELKRKEEAKKAEEERIAAEKAEEEERKAQAEAAAALEAKTKTLAAGKYVVGRDIDAGLYDTKAISGQGNFVVTGGLTGLKVNEMFGTGGGFYNDSFNNVELEDGDEIEINNDLKVKFLPKE